MSSKIYCCKLCAYKTETESNFKRHMMLSKHTYTIDKVIEDAVNKAIDIGIDETINKSVDDIIENNNCLKCGKILSKNYLQKHFKTCKGNLIEEMTEKIKMEKKQEIERLLEIERVDEKMRTMRKIFKARRKANYTRHKIIQCGLTMLIDDVLKAKESEKMSAIGKTFKFVETIINNSESNIPENKETFSSDSDYSDDSAIDEELYEFDENKYEDIYNDESDDDDKDANPTIAFKTIKSEEPKAAVKSKEPEEPKTAVKSK